MGWRALVVVGRVSVLIGLLLLSFVAFALWGTGLITARDQSRLRTEFDHRLPSGAVRAAAKAAAGAAAKDADRRDGPAGTGGGADNGTGAGAGQTDPELAAPAVAMTETTPAAGQPVGSIDIPGIGLNMVVVQGVAAAQLALGPGHYPGTPLPGEAGNVAIAGHRTTYLHPFYNLTAVQAGTEVVLTTTQGVFVYVVGSQSVVTPTTVSVIGPSSADTLTLTTCNPRYSAATRLVVRATLASSQLFSPPTSPLGSAVRAGIPQTVGGSNQTRGTAGKAEPIASRTPSSARLGSVRVGSAPGDPPAHLVSIIGWGAAATSCGIVTWWFGRRRCHRWAFWLPGATATLAVLFFFYASLVSVLPASL